MMIVAVTKMREKPDKCGDCDFCNPFIHAGTNTFCTINPDIDIDLIDVKRDEKCPLVSMYSY